MFGTLRLLLALSVALAHAGVSLYGHHIGVPSVVVFFMLSGYVVASLLARSFPARSDVPAFYLERFLRLAPLYFLFLLVAYAAYRVGVATPWLAGPPNLALWLANVFVVPLNYYMFYERIDSFFLIPVAWSLGLEIQFYLLAPWLLKTAPRLLAATVLSLTVYAVANLGWLHADWYGYRLLCGNLFMFLAGVLLFKARDNRRWRLLLVAQWLAVLLLVVVCGLLDRWQGSFVLETGTGFVIGLPVLAWLSEMRRRRLDDRLGDLAYGVFLAHFPVMWLAGWAGWLTDAHPIALYLALCVAAAALGHLLVERPIVRWRHRLRARRLQ